MPTKTKKKNDHLTLYKAATLPFRLNSAVCEMQFELMC